MCTWVDIAARNAFSSMSAIQSLHDLCTCDFTSTCMIVNLPSLPVSGSNPLYTLLCSSLPTLVKPSTLPVLFKDVFLTNSKLSRLSLARRSWCVTRTSFVTKIWLQDAITVGQKIGMEAHIIAKSTSRQEMIRTSGYHQV